MPTPSQRLRERGTGLCGRSALEVKTLTGRGAVNAPFMYITVYGIIYIHMQWMKSKDCCGCGYYYRWPVSPSSFSKATGRLDGPQTSVLPLFASLSLRGLCLTAIPLTLSIWNCLFRPILVARITERQ